LDEKRSGFVMRKLLGLVAVPVIAGAIIGLTTASVWAFTQQTLTPNGNYDFNYSPLEGKNKPDKSATPDPNSPGFHFSIERGQPGPFGFHSFGSDKNPGPPDFSRPLGNGD
jgi:hypothetical protein